jgi:Na+/H+-dicarboxylate symporter
MSLNRKLTIAIAAGLVLGFLFALEIIPHSFFGIDVVEILRFVGMVFMLLLKAVVVPLIFFSIFVGVTSLGNTKQLGRMGIRTVVYYFCTTFIAVVIGLALVNAIKPGSGFAVGGASGGAAAQVVGDYSLAQMIAHQVTSFIKNPFEALASGTSSMIAIILAGLVLGIAVLRIAHPKKSAVVDAMNVLNDAVMWVTKKVIELAPYGVFGLLASVLFDERDQLYELGTGLTLFAMTAYIGLAIHGTIVLPLILKVFSRRPILTFFKGIADALKVAFGTDSSLAAMPVTLTSLQDNLKVSRKTSDFVIPLGATINMDGTALYEAVCAIFIAQALNIELTIVQQIIIFLTATVASVGAAGIPSAGLVTLVIVINAVGLPYDQAAPIIGMIFAIDRLIDVFRTTVNVEGDCVGCVIIDEMEEKDELATAR